jgi:hypothetical protein
MRKMGAESLADLVKQAEKLAADPGNFSRSRSA